MRTLQFLVVIVAALIVIAFTTVLRAQTNCLLDANYDTVRCGWDDADACKRTLQRRLEPACRTEMEAHLRRIESRQVKPLPDPNDGSKRDLRKSTPSQSVLYAHAPTLKEQRARCEQREVTACLHLDRYIEHSKQCRADYSEEHCEQALTYPFAERPDLPATREIARAYAADNKACLKDDVSACDRVITSPASATAAGRPVRDRAITHRTSIIIARENLQRAREAEQAEKEAQKLQKAEPKVVIPEPAPKAATRPTDKNEKALRNSDAQLKELTPPAQKAPVISDSKTSVLATPLPLIIFGLLSAAALLAYLLQRQADATWSLRNNLLNYTGQLGRYVSSNPTAILKFVATLLVIGLAIWFILTFTLLAVTFAALAGGAGLYAYLRSPQRRS